MSWGSWCPQWHELQCDAGRTKEAEAAGARARNEEEEKKDEYLFHVLVQKAFLSKEKLTRKVDKADYTIV